MDNVQNCGSCMNIHLPQFYRYVKLELLVMKIGLGSVRSQCLTIDCAD
jgi:hypothetical protein